MPETGPEIGLATKADIAGILELQDANQLDRGGLLSVGFPRQWFEARLSDTPVIVARRDGRIVAYLISSSIEAQASAPIVQAMLKAYPHSPSAYIYGPVCVADEERGHGLASALFADLLARVPDRECFTFIRADNAASLRAHAKMGMRTVATFTLGDVDYVVVAYGA
jgi:predicted GNAT superfamily acetyltransferase